MDYAELQCRSYFSFLRGASSPHDLIKRAAELELKALAITDRDGVYGIPQAFKASQGYPNLKLVVGAELSLEQPLTLLASTRKGYGTLCRLLTESHQGKPKGKAFLNDSEFFSLLQKHGSQGLICLCRLGRLAPFGSRYRELKEYFPVYVALNRFLDGRDPERTQMALQIKEEYDIPIVATNDVHFHAQEKSRLQDVLVSIREIVPLDQIGKKVFSNSERYLKSSDQMRKLFRDLPEAIENTIKIADQCSFSPAELRYRYPSEWIPAGETAQSYLEKVTWKGAQLRYPRGLPYNVRRQLEHELRLVKELSFADYFLTIWEIVEFARSKKILCQGRGSAANSIICYCLGITAIDPVKMDLLLERFISAERGEPPDIDVDFEHERREEVIQHVYEKYGRDRAGMVAAVITYRTRSARRDISKALSIPPEDERITPFIEEIRGFPRHLSIHSGGFTLSADPIIETVPIEPARMEGRTIVQWDKEDLAIIGLLKVDLLALGMLSAMRKTFDLIAPKRKLTIATTPHDDPATYRMIQKADTIGVFQIESRAQMSMLGRLLPENFYDIVIEVAIVRPGPIVGQMVHPYLKRRRGLESPKSPDPRLEPILSRTLGVPLFQEQVMKIAIVMAGFTPGESDELRRAIGAWRSSGSIEKLGKRLMNGLLENGLPREFVERIFKQIQGFAEYGFPESHAASFGLLAYVSSYLKCHYPAEFTCALLNSQPMGFYSSHSLIDDVKRHGVPVYPVHPELSHWDSTLENSGIRVGFRAVNGLPKTDAERIMKERPFQNLADFIARTRLSFRHLQTLAMGGAFECFELEPRQALWEILQDSVLNEPAREPQLALFNGSELKASEKLFPSLSEYEMIQADYQSFGLSTRGHPMQAFRTIAGKRISATTTASVKRASSGTVARLSGLIIVRQRPPTAKGTVFATLEDEMGLLDLILHKEIYEKCQDVFLECSFLTVTGKIQRDANTINLIVRALEPIQLSKNNSDLRVASHDFH